MRALSGCNGCERALWQTKGTLVSNSDGGGGHTEVAQREHSAGRQRSRSARLT